MKRYICGAKDHWADLLDQRFLVTQESRAKVSLMGDKKILELAQPKLRCLSEYIEAYATLTRKFPTDSSTCANSWIRRPTFNSSNILTKINNRNRAGHTVNSFKQDNFNLHNNIYCMLSNLYTGRRFILRDALQDLVRTKTGDEHKVSEKSNMKLQNSIIYVIGHRKTLDGI